MTDEQKAAIQALIDETYQTAKDRGWWEEENPNIPEKLALIHSEVSEALEDYRNSRRVKEETGWELHELFFCSDDGDITNQPWIADGAPLGTQSAYKPCGFPSELADVVIRVFDLAAHLNIDLLEALERKMEYNKHRPYRHGGKLC